ncbi:replication initiator [Nonomuraea sp. CA-141351]|uniref:replication initiator n=1 Tax=Nonomuraea sp. CA-141351 TaxID=3239996 RepID=UPI003D930E71
MEGLHPNVQEDARRRAAPHRLHHPRHGGGLQTGRGANPGHHHRSSSPLASSPAFSVSYGGIPWHWPRSSFRARSVSCTAGASRSCSSLLLSLVWAHGRSSTSRRSLDGSAVRAARDALHFSKLVDRFVQNLRRVAGYDVQYFATVESQKRLAPHLHMAIRGTLPRAEMKQIAAATYHQVWWPQAEEARFEGDHLPVWNDGVGYVDPDTGEVLPTWDEALDQLGDEPMHVIRFGDQVDVKGVLAGSPDADHCIRYLSKYLTKSLGETLDGQAQREHAARFVDALRYEPCAPTCPNWLRYGVQPKNAKPGMVPGQCRSKAHKPEHLGYAGRRVLVSRKWSNKTLAEHKQDRRTWVLEALGQADEPTDPHRYVWQPVRPGDPDVSPIGVRLLRSIAERQRWRAHLRRLEELSATPKAA